MHYMIMTFTTTFHVVALFATSMLLILLLITLVSKKIINKTRLFCNKIVVEIKKNYPQGCQIEQFSQNLRDFLDLEKKFLGMFIGRLNTLFKNTVIIFV